MHTTPTPKVIRATPLEIVEALPRLIGYVPHRSLLLVAMGSPENPDGPLRMRTAARFDLPTSQEDAAGLTDAVRHVLTEGPLRGTPCLLAVLWDERLDLPIEQAEQIASAVVGWTHAHTTTRVHTLVTVTAQKVLGWTHEEHGPVPVSRPRQETTSVLQTELVADGRAAAADRDALGASILPTEHARPLDQDMPAPEQMQQVWHRLLTHDAVPTSDLHVLAAAVTDQYTGSAIGSRILGLGEGDPNGLDLGPSLTMAQRFRMLSHLRATCRSVIVTGADLHAVTALTAWSVGDGTLANLAVDHALHLDAHHRMAALVASALRAGIDPPPVRTDTSQGGPR